MSQFVNNKDPFRDNTENERGAVKNGTDMLHPGRELSASLTGQCTNLKTIADLLHWPRLAFCYRGQGGAPQNDFAP